MKSKILQSIILQSIILVGIMLGITGCSDMAEQPQESVGFPAAQDAREETEILRMTFLDTGKSDCIIMDVGDCVIINDTADADDYELISSFLDERQIKDIDYMVLSHFDKDHIGSAAQLINDYDVGCVMMPDYEEDSVYYAALMEALEHTETKALKLQDDYSFKASGAEFYISVPDEQEYKDDNNYSLITAVSYGENRFLLMGDAKKKRTEEFLKTAPGEERYELIKMPHHGDYNKKLDDLLECARPAWAILTAGQERRKLEEETLQLLEKYGCKVYDTTEGNITAESDGKNIVVTQSMD